MTPRTHVAAAWLRAAPGRNSGCCRLLPPWWTWPQKNGQRGLMASALTGKECARFISLTETNFPAPKLRRTPNVPSRRGGSCQAGRPQEMSTYCAPATHAWHASDGAGYFRASCTPAATTSPIFISHARLLRLHQLFLFHLLGAKAERQRRCSGIRFGIRRARADRWSLLRRVVDVVPLLHGRSGTLHRFRERDFLNRQTNNLLRFTSNKLSKTINSLSSSIRPTSETNLHFSMRSCRCLSHSAMLSASAAQQQLTNRLGRREGQCRS